MPIFKEIKEHLTARQVAEHYGLKVGRNGMACCPFHDDKHPSMKIDTGYYCFGCGAHGDAIGYVALMYCLSQYDAACKLVEDFSLPIETHPTDEREQEKARMKWRKEKEERDKIIHIKDRFKKWCFVQIDILHEAEDGIQQIKDSFWNATPDEVFGSPEFEAAVNAEPLIGYWLDILCMGTDEERIELFMKGRGEVERYVRKVAGAVERRLGRSRGNTGCGLQQCG